MSVEAPRLGVYPLNVRRAVFAGLTAGESVSSVSRRLGVSRSTVRVWRTEGLEAARSECPTCDSARLESIAYSALLGFYLGDGAISKAHGCHVLRVSCDAKYPGIVDDVDDLMHRVRPHAGRTCSHESGSVSPGLFHSDGARVANWARSPVGKRYDYPRWQFSNRSEDIHTLCQSTLDLVGVEWRRSNRWTTSVSKHEAVAKLDGLIGLKS
jgi:hypothetical protein